MADQQEDKSSYPIPAILLIVVIIAGGIFRFYAPLDTLRTPLNDKDVEWSLGEENVLARMWQDPFQAIENHIRRTKNQDEFFKVSQATKQYKGFKSELDPEIHNILILPVMVTAGGYGENIEDRLRSRYAVLSALRVAGYIPKDAEHIGYFEREILGQPRTIPYEWFTLDPLPLNLPSPSSETYDAILVLWLSDEYFKNKQIEELRNLFEYIHGCFKDKQLTMKVLGPTNSTYLKEIILEAFPDNCPLYKYLEKKHKYLTAKDVSDAVKSEAETAENDLKKEIQETVTDRKVAFEMYSPWATADPLLMMAKRPMQSDMLAKIYKEVRDDAIFKEEDIFKLILKYTGVILQRSIHTDHQLTSELVKELSRRVRNIERKSSGDIILISDWDTFYGRALPLSFATSFLEKYNGKNNIPLHEKIHIFSYMRGIDGMISNENIDFHSSPKKAADAVEKIGNYSNSGYFIPAFKQPSGQDQFDYIRRLTDRIIQEHSKHKIIAIGVLGNDIYDKLLILRALYDQFPSAIFFTTDLDARLYHHTELPWTRNLIVASSYGLQLHSDYQRAIPPFRSTYQTALFAAVLQSLGIINKPDFDEIPPRIFEIGNRGAYDLSLASESPSNSSREKALYPDRNDVWRSSISLNDWKAYEWMASKWRDGLFDLFFLFFLPVSVFAGCFYYVIQKTKNDNPRTWKKYWIPFLASCVLSFTALTVCAFISSWSGDGEPITFFDGVSIWPTELLRLTSGFLALYFLLYSIQEISLNHGKINQFCTQSKTNSKPTDENPHSVLAVVNTWENYKGRKESNNSWNFIGIAAVAYLCAGYLFIRTCGEPLIPFRGELSWWADKCILISSLLSMLTLIAFVINTTWLCTKFIKEFTDPTTKDAENTSEKLSALCSLKDNTCRKDFEGCPAKYPECLNKYDRKMTENTSGYWFTMKIIGEKTKVTGEMIKYPFLILFLLLVSRHKYFDNWTWTVPLALVIGLTTLIALGFTILLFYKANTARQQMIARLREEMLGLINTRLPEKVDAFDDKKSKLIEQRIRSIEYVMNEIQNMKSGAFSPNFSFRNPILMAILTPLGGVGSISLFHQLAQFIKD